MIINFIAFQVGWFSAVLSAAAGYPLLGLGVMAAVIALHLFRSIRPGQEIILLLACGVVGGIWDSVLVAMGWVGYNAGMLLPWLAPYWIIAMWMLFATTLNESLGWLKGRVPAAVLLGLAGGPLAYLTGAKLNGILLLEPRAALIALGLGWGVMMPILLQLADRFDGVTRPLADPVRASQ